MKQSKNLSPSCRQVRDKKKRSFSSSSSSSSSSSQPHCKKSQKLHQRRTAQTQILTLYKTTQNYYDPQTDEWHKQKYYLDLPQNPTYQDLHQLVASTFRHARRRDNIFPIVDRQPDYRLVCVYSGRVLSDGDGEMLEKCDQEHAFPQSYQRGTKSGTGRDMHAIFAACKSANGSRGNTPFGIYSDKQVPISNDQFGTIYSGTPDNKKKTYIPKLNSGAVARSTLYILVCYKNCANPDYLPPGTLNWLINEASSKEVSLWEKHRNQELFRLQGNRNPFIDFPKLALQIDFREGWQK